MMNLLLFPLLLATWPSPPAACDGVARHERGAGVSIVVVEGSETLTARKIGELYAERLRAEALANQPLDRAPSIPAWCREEVTALAEGAKLPPPAILHTQEIAPPARSRVVQLAALADRTAGGRLLHYADLPRQEGSLPVVHVQQADGRIAYAYVTYPGHLGGFAGVNAFGISASISGVLAKDNRIGFDLQMLVRRVLRDARSLSEAVKLVGDAPLSGSGLVVLGDGKTPGARTGEIAEGKINWFGPADAAEAAAGLPVVPNTVVRASTFRDRKHHDPVDLPFSARQKRLLQLLTEDRQLVPAAFLSTAGRDQELPEAPFIVMAPFSGDFWIGAGGGTRGYRLSELLAEHPAEPPADDRRSTVRVSPKRTDDGLPELYRLEPEPFEASIEPLQLTGGVLRYRVLFPSPLESPYRENNTVYGEFFRPFGPGPFPCIIMLHIAGGDFDLSRFMSSYLAQHGLAGLFIKLPYYGERRPPGKKVRMISGDLELGLSAMRQAVLDLRRACDWIESHPDLKKDQIGIMGVSLGGITGGLACAIEPRISHACLIMGGGKLADILFESQEKDAIRYREEWIKAGGTRESFAKIMAPFDVSHYGERLKQRVVLMISADEDQTIPKSSTLALWEATGRQSIIWYPCGHYTMARYLIPGMNHAVTFFRNWPGQTYDVTHPK